MGKIIYLFKKDGVYMDNSMIKKKADEILELYEVNDCTVDPAIIARKANIPIRNIVFKPMITSYVSGGIKKEKDSIEIYVNKNDVNNRKRFTIAHELGHFFLNHLDNKGEFVDLHRDMTTSGNIDEKNANEFAACILMKEEYVKEKFKTMQDVGFSTNYIIEKLANIFVVSKQAMTLRLKNLNLIR